jgi:DNA polymerase-1
VVALPTIEVLKQAVEEIKRGKIFAFDLETKSTHMGGLGFNPFTSKIDGFSLAVDHVKDPLECYYKCCPSRPQVGRGWYFSFNRNDPDRIDQTAAFALLAPVLADASRSIVTHNGKFDLKFLLRVGVEVACPLIDTCIASWIVDENQPNRRLKDTIERLFGHQMVRFDEVETLFGPDMAVYGKDDARQTLRLWRHFEPLIERDGLTKVFHELECRIPEILARMELAGVAIDTDKLEGIRETIGVEVEQVEAECYRLAGRRFLISSPAELSKLLFDELKWQKRGEIRRTVNGYSTDKEILQRYEKDQPLAAAVLRHRELTKLESTYLNPLVKAAKRLDGRVRSSFNQIQSVMGGGGTVTGRLSSSADDELGGCNLQNIPSRTKAGKQIRFSFVAPPGKLLVVGDFSQIEVRFMAHYSKDPTLLEAYCRWRCGACKSDGLTTDPLHACPKCGAPDEIKQPDGKIKKGKMSPQGEPAPGLFCLGLDIHQITADACGVSRDLGKILNFALLYGLGAEGLARHLKIKVAEAKRIHRAYFDKYVGVVAHNLWVKRQLQEHGRICTVTRRQRRFPQRRGQELNLWDRDWRMAANSCIQGSSADLTKITMRNTHNRMIRERYYPDTFMILQVHDELVLETPEERADDTSHMLQHEMENALRLRVPVLADVKQAPSWGAAK